MDWRPAQQPSRLPKWFPQRLRAPLRWLIKWAVVASIMMLAVVMFYFYKAQKFDLADVASMPERSVLLDRNGNNFGYVHGERRRLITRDEIPEFMVQALRAREDLRFYEHVGVDGKGLARATLRNIKDRSFTQGASTLTMQLARNTYEMRAKSLHRKFLEIALTLRIESHYSKDEILTHYLNRIYFGSGCHGVEEAAQTYFGRSASELNRGECALLVGIIRGPHIFSPFRNIDGAKVQRDEVLDRMVACGFLKQSDQDAVLAEPIRLVNEKSRHRNSTYVRESIRYQLQRILDKHDIRAGGLKIHTTIDSSIQEKCENLMKKPFKGLKDNESLQAAAVMTNPETGGIIALCGGRDYSKSQFNRVYLAKRDLGPAYIPFLDAMALERSKVVITGNSVQTGRQLGIEETIRLSQRLGFSGPYQKTEDLYRGAIAVSPMEVAGAAAAITNGGESIETHLISKITDANGQVVYQFDPAISQPISKAVANDVIKSLESKKGKLVTCSSACRDGWAISLDSKSIAVIWLGCDNPKKLGERKAVKFTLESLLGGIQSK